MPQSMKWFTLALVLSSLPVLAVPLPAEQLTIEFIKEVPGNKDSAGAARLWRQLYGGVTNQVRGIWKKYGPDRPITPEEQECLRQKASEDDLEQAAPHMSADYRTFSGEILHQLRKQDGERCPKGSAGLAAFKSFTRDRADRSSTLERALEEGKAAARAMAGRPLTPAEVAAITAAIVFSAPVWALP